MDKVVVAYRCVPACTYISVYVSSRSPFHERLYSIGGFLVFPVGFAVSSTQIKDTIHYVIESLEKRLSSSPMRVHVC